MAETQASYLFRFLDDFLDLLPKEDRDLFATIWSALNQAAADIMGLTLETDLSLVWNEIPVHSTERWNRYVLGPDTADMEVVEQFIPLTGVIPTILPDRTAFQRTLRVTDPAKVISYTELVGFTGDEEISLVYNRIVASTATVTAGAVAFQAGRDYVINERQGTMKRVEGTRIAPNQILTLTYQHEYYRLDLDYILDPYLNTIKRTPGSQIPASATVLVSYVIDNTGGPSLVSRAGAALPDLATVEDFTQSFTGMLPGRVLTVLEGPNAGDYLVSAVISANRLMVSTPFLVAVASGLAYTVDAFPFGMKINPKIISIPTMQDRVTNSSLTLVEGIDYLARDGYLGFRMEPPVSAISQLADGLPIFWAEKTLVNQETPYRNFGVLIDFYRTNSSTYVDALRGLLYAYWTGSTNENLIRGIHILLGLPFTPRAGTVFAVDETSRAFFTAPGDNVVALSRTWTFAGALFSADDIGRKVRVSGAANDQDFVITDLVSTTQVITDGTPTDETFVVGSQVLVHGAPASVTIRNDRGLDTVYTIPLGLTALVEAGDSVTAFQSLCSGVSIYDKINEPGFVRSRLGLAGISRFLTSAATTNDKDKALTTLEENLFIASVLVEAVTAGVNVDEVTTFLEQLKPKWTEFIFQFNVEVDDQLVMGETFSPTDIVLGLDLTTTVINNEQNLGEVLDTYTGRIELVGGQNVLRDSTVDLSGYNAGDSVEILSGANAGTYLVTEQLASDTLALTPEPPVADPLMHYRVISQVLNLGHDAVQLDEDTYFAATGIVSTGGVLAFPGELLLTRGIRPGMQLLLTLGGVPVPGPTYDGIFDITAVTQESITLSPAPADNTYDIEIAHAYLRATAPGPVVGLPLSQAL